MATSVEVLIGGSVIKRWDREPDDTDESWQMLVDDVRRGYDDSSGPALLPAWQRYVVREVS